MANGASRIFNVIKNTNDINDTNNLLSVTVKTLNPLTFKIDDKLSIEPNFYILSEDIDVNKLQIGDILNAFTFNNGQLYYINQGISTKLETSKIINKVDNLKYGYKNLLLKKDIYSYDSKGTLDKTEYLNNGKIIFTRGTILNSGFYIDNKALMKPNTDYLIHFKAKVIEGSVLGLRVYSQFNHKYSMVYCNGNKLGEFKTSDMDLITLENNVEYDFLLKFTTNDIIGTSSYAGDIIQFNKTNTNAFTIELTDLKWEEGNNQPTTWTPPMEDILATKSDKKFANKSLSSVGWYRIAKITRNTNPSYASSIINLHTMWNNTAPQGTIFLATAMGSERKIAILSSNTPYQFTKLRITTKDNIDYIEAYYKLTNFNNVYVEVLDNNTAINAIAFETAEEDETVQATYDITNYDVTSAIGILSSLTTTDKTNLVNALNELRLQTRSYMNGANIQYTGLLTDRTFDEIMGLDYPSVFTINGNETTKNGAGFPTGAYAYGLLITYKAASAYARTQIYIPDGPKNQGIYIRTRVGGSWMRIKQQNITTGTEFATNEYIDDKQVYRKRINFGALPNATTKNVAHGLTDFTLIRTNCVATNTSTNQNFILPYASPTGIEYNMSLYINNTNVQIVTGIDRSAYNSCYVDLYYIKNS